MTVQKVFGIGMMKTGTSTLADCFTQLGYRHRSYYPKLIRQVDRGDFSTCWDVVDEYESFEDNPWPMLFEELDRRYPESKFILTVRRDADTWFRSLDGHARRRGPTAERKIVYGHAWPGRHRDDHISMYDAHNDRVRRHFEDRPDQFLEVCWETGSTFDDVARFLGRPLPEVDESAAPKRNSAESQSISWRAWARNTAKYVTISGLRFDPFLYRDPKQ